MKKAFVAACVLLALLAAPRPAHGGLDGPEVGVLAYPDFAVHPSVHQ